MSDVVLVALIAAFPSTIAAVAGVRSSKRSKHISEAVGKKNGMGNLIEMNENQLRWQGTHDHSDAMRFDALFNHVGIDDPIPTTARRHQ